MTTFLHIPLCNAESPHSHLSAVTGGGTSVKTCKSENERVIKKETKTTKQKSNVNCNNEKKTCHIGKAEMVYNNKWLLGKYLCIRNKHI